MEKSALDIPKFIIGGIKPSDYNASWCFKAVHVSLILKTAIGQKISFGSYYNTHA
jgi:hypothetical protein